METIGELSEFLSCFEPGLPLNVLVASGAPFSELVGFSAMGQIDPVVVRSAGAVTGVWLVARHGSAGPAVGLPPVIVMSRSDCGCQMEVPVVLDRPVATWAIECEHSPSAKT